MAGRIYVVETEDTISLVRATSPVQAINHVVKGQYSARVATADDMEEYGINQGAKVENAMIKIGNMEVPDPSLAEEEESQ